MVPLHVPYVKRPTKAGKMVHVHVHVQLHVDVVAVCVVSLCAGH